MKEQEALIYAEFQAHTSLPGQKKFSKKIRIAWPYEGSGGQGE